MYYCKKCAEKNEIITDKVVTWKGACDCCGEVTMICQAGPFQPDKCIDTIQKVTIDFGELLDIKELERLPFEKIIEETKKTREQLVERLKRDPEALMLFNRLSALIEIGAERVFIAEK